MLFSVSFGSIFDPRRHLKKIIEKRFVTSSVVRIWSLNSDAGLPTLRKAQLHNFDTAEEIQI